MSNTSLKFPIVVIIIFMLTIMIISYTRKSSMVWVEEPTPITKANTQKKAIAFACNVYEGSTEIKSMLQIMDKKNVKISFFLGGIWVDKNRELVEIMKNKGHDLQNHGYYHKRPSVLNTKKNINEIKDAEELILRVCGVKTNLFEPPYGDYDENTLAIMNTINYKLVTWSIDTIDWRNDATKEVILNRIKKKLHPGAIILIHPKPVTASAFEEIIGFVQSQGYEIETVSNIINQH